VAVGGADAGTVQTDYVFDATTRPLTTTLPLTYTWQATDQVGSSHTALLTDSQAFSWQSPGIKTITVTAQNPLGLVTATHRIAIHYVPLSAVTIGEESRALMGRTTVLRASVSPPTATLPITYTWSPEPANGQGTANAAYTWQSPGVEQITVTASNPAGAASGSRPVTVYIPVYLPLLVKELSMSPGSRRGMKMSLLKTTPTRPV
jgi:PKD repeat protein